MGITIHYTGAFNSTKNLSDMISELEDIAKIQKWKYFIYEREFPKDKLKYPWGDKELFDHENIYGISITPPNCETIDFTFLSNGFTSSNMALSFWGNAKVEIEKELLYQCFTKTQFAGKEMHKIIIHIFKYITQKYYLQFEMNDEANYWDANNEAELGNYFSRMNFLMDAMELRLSNQKMEKGESIIDFIKRQANEISKNENNGENKAE